MNDIESIGPRIPRIEVSMFGGGIELTTFQRSVRDLQVRISRISRDFENLRNYTMLVNSR